MNGIRYMQRCGVPWDAMPKDVPPGSICYDDRRVLADGGHLDRIDHMLVMADREQAGRVAEVVKRPEFAKGFVLLPKRWRVEQGIGVLTISHRLRTDHETLTHVSAAAILFASIGRPLASPTMRCPFPTGL